MSHSDLSSRLKTVITQMDVFLTNGAVKGTDLAAMEKFSRELGYVQRALYVLSLDDMRDAAKEATDQVMAEFSAKRQPEPPPAVVERGLKSQLKEIVSRMEALGSKEKFTSDDVAEMSAASTEAAKIECRLAALETAERARARLATPAQAVTTSKLQQQCSQIERIAHDVKEDIQEAIKECEGLLADRSRLGPDPALLTCHMPGFSKALSIAASNVLFRFYEPVLTDALKHLHEQLRAIGAITSAVTFFPLDDPPSAK